MLKKIIQEQKIIELLKIHYDIDIQVVHLFPGGADMNAFVYKADAKASSYFVKLKYGHYDEINLSITRLLHNSGINEIIFPVQTRERKLFQQLTHFNIIVYPFIHAQNGFTQNLTEEQWKQLGKMLRKVHGTSIPDLMQQQLRKENYSNKWREMVKCFFSKIEPLSADDKITREFKSFFKININKIHQLVDFAEVLSKKIQPNFDKYVLCHSDIHAGNILIASDESIYLIDWDEPMLAPKERDLMFIGGGIGNVWNKLQEVNYFYEGYGATNIDEIILSYYRHERIVEDIALYGQDLLAHDKKDQSRLELFKHFKAMFDQNGVVDVAFATVK